MTVHENARTVPHSRMLIVQRLGAAAAGVTAKTVRKCSSRHAAESEPGLVDRSSRPHHSPTCLDAANEDAVDAFQLGDGAQAGPPCLRRRPGAAPPWPRTPLRPRPPSTPRPLRRPAARRADPHRHQNAGRIDGLRHCITSAGSGRSRRAAGRGRKPRKLRRLHVATNDPSRLGSYSAAPQRAPGNSTLAWFKQHDVTVERVMTDNGPAYKSKLFAAALVHRGIAISGPYTPRPMARPSASSRAASATDLCQPTHQLSRSSGRHASWLLACNIARLHSALGGTPPISRLTRDNLLCSNL